MQHTKLKKFVILLGLILPTVWCGANGIQLVDGHSLIIIYVHGILWGVYMLW